MPIIKPGVKFGNTDGSRHWWKKDIYEQVVKPTRKNLVPYDVIQRNLVLCRGDIEKAQKFVNKNRTPANLEILIDLHNRLCDLEEVVVGLCAVVSHELGYDPNREDEDNDSD